MSGAAEGSRSGQRLLFVSFAFAPILSPECLQATRTARTLAARGWRITVLTVDERTSPGEQDPELERSLDGLRAHGALRIVKAPSAERLLLFARAAPLHLAMHLGLPEGQLLWYPAAVRAGRELLREPFDAIVSRSAFPTSNVVGLALKRTSGLPWLAHFSDPWVDSPYFPRRPLQRLASATLERRIVRAADRLTFTSAETADLVMAKYPAPWRAKVHVIPHGYERDQDVTVARSPGPLRLVYSGTFYTGLRTPMPLLDALHELGSRRLIRGALEVTFVGPTPREYIAASERLGLGEIVRFFPRFSLEEAHRQAERADVLVLIDAPSGGSSVFLPSKLIDYLPYRRPILGLTPERGASADLLRRLGFTPVPPTDPRAISEALAELLEAHRAGALQLPAAFDRVAADFHIERTTGRLEEVLREMISQARPTRNDREAP